MLKFISYLSKRSDKKSAILTPEFKFLQVFELFGSKLATLHSRHAFQVFNAVWYATQYLVSISCSKLNFTIVSLSQEYRRTMLDELQMRFCNGPLIILLGRLIKWSKKISTVYIWITVQIACKSSLKPEVFWREIFVTRNLALFGQAKLEIVVIKMLKIMERWKRRKEGSPIFGK